LAHHYHSFLYTKVQSDLGKVPKDVKTLIFGMFIYMIGWGIVDPFMSIIIHNITKSYTLAGFFYGLLFFVGVVFAIPVGDLSDKVNKIRYIVLSMSVYPVITLLYFAVSFVEASLSLALLFIARLLHGGASLLWIPMEGFVRSKSPRDETSATFGLFMTFNKLTYVIAPLFLIPIVWFFGISLENIHWLLLLLIPFPIISVFFISKIWCEGLSIRKGVREVIVKDGIFKKEFHDLKKLGFVGYFSLLIGFFMRSIEAVVLFLIPLYARSLNLGLVEISILFSLISLPYLFSFFLAELADSFGKINLISIGFVAASIAMIAIAFYSRVPGVFFIACIFLGLILALLQPAVNGLITDITPRVNDGEMTGMLKAVLKVGAFVSAITLGFLSDAFSLQFPFLVFAVLLLAMSILTYSIKGKVVVRI